MVLAWSRVLDDVPVERLGDAYVAAMKARAFAGLITPNEINAAWVEMERVRKRKIAETTSRDFFADYDEKLRDIRRRAAIVK